MFYSKDCYDLNYPTEDGVITLYVSMPLPRYITETEILRYPRQWVSTFNKIAIKSSDSVSAEEELAAKKITIKILVGKENEKVLTAKIMCQDFIVKTTEKYLKDMKKEEEIDLGRKEQNRKDRETEQRLRDQYGNTL